jgi:hypothetical protein
MNQETNSLVRLPIIGIAGHRGAGKNEVANAIEREHGWFQLAFADPVRTGLLAIDPVIIVENSCVRLSELVRKIGWNEAKKIYEVRRLHQKYATEAGRNIHGEDCWVDIAHQRILQIESVVNWGSGVLITDVRFPNELQFIRNHGIGCIYVHRPSIVDGSPELQHESETHLADIRRGCVATIVNDRNVEQLHKMALDVFHLISQSDVFHLISQTT